jgi:Flp pilus assembly protein TadG
MCGATSYFAATFRRLATCRNGGTAVETAIVLPVLMLAIVGAIMEGWMLYSTNMLFFAVESAARCAAVNTTTCGGTTPAKQIAAIQAYAVTQSWGLNVTPASFQVTTGNTCGVQVTGNYPFTFFMPFLALFAPAAGNDAPTYNIVANACFPVD